MGFCVGLFVGWGVWGRKPSGKVSSRISRMNTDSLKGDERKVYDLLKDRDGSVGFWAGRTELGWGDEKMKGVVGGLKKRKVVRVRDFGSRRILELVGFLREGDREVLEFVRKRGGRVSVSEVEEGLGMDDNSLWRVGKRLVRLGVLGKVRKGYDTFFVLG